MDAIIEEIEEGKWFVSMECLFNDFDYAAVSPEGQQVVIAREEASAFLTKHLRAYGGSGEYEGYKLGRVLKNISFSGKGLVSNPANPRSVILESDPFSKTEAKSINEFNIQENSNMADERLVQQIEELKATLAEALAAKADLEAKLANASTEALAGELEEVKAEVESKTQAFTELQEQFDAVSEEKVQLESALAEKEEKLNEALAAIEKAEAEARLAARKAALVEAGAEEEEIEGILEAFAEATDEMFEQVVALKKKANFPPKKDEEEEKEEEALMKKKALKEKEDEEALKKKKANKKSKSEEEAEAEDAEEVDEAEASEEVLEQVEEQAEAALVDAGETDEVVSARAVASEWLTENVLRTIQ
jgi:chemotaxis protein histidine kinase CheA